jgi:chorismate-pyruvate lyase
LRKEAEPSGESLFRLFTAQDEKPKHLSGLDLGALTHWQRAWLALDGTVTTFFESYTMEPIRVVRLLQRNQPLLDDDPWLQARKGEAVVDRHVLLQGESSHRLRVYAASLLLPDRLPEMVREDLSIEGAGLGRILQKRRVEQFRELLWYGTERVRDLPEALHGYRDAEFLSRTYRIFVGGRPIVLIHERVPLVEAADLPGSSAG